MNIPIKKFIPGIAWFFVVLILICTPGPDLPELGDWFGELSMDKFIHCGIFGLLALLWNWPVLKSTLADKLKKQWFLKIALAVSIFGFITELLQKYYIPGRSFSLIDCLADVIGAFGALIVARFFLSKKA